MYKLKRLNVVKMVETKQEADELISEKKFELIETDENESGMPPAAPSKTEKPPKAPPKTKKEKQAAAQDTVAEGSTETAEVNENEKVE